MNYCNLRDIAVDAALIAGEKILEIYNNKNFEVEFKNDNSPLTIADKISNKIILNKLKKTKFPVLSEEGLKIPYDKRKKWKNFWMIDPIDGTKEFIKKNGEFTVNIALIENNIPVIGVVYAPYLKELYIADKLNGSFKIENIQNVDEYNLKNFISLDSLKLPNYYSVVVSKSHLNDETKMYVEKLKQKHKNVVLHSFGSSLKICKVADRSANCYPRFGPTMEWDTAAAHAIIKYSNGLIINFIDKKELKYNKKNLLNPHFVVYNTIN